MQNSWNGQGPATHLSAPGQCADCGADAYIRMDGSPGVTEMLCAHCFAERTHAGKTPTSDRPDTTADPEKGH